MHDLAAFPSVVRQWMESVPSELLTRPPAAGGFTLIENAWHLADLEAEGYGVRLRRILAETSPSLPDFQGDVIAQDRDYLHLPLAPALERFERARAENIALIEAATETDRQRTGQQEGAGTITFERVIAMMNEHDVSHVEEITALCRELGIN
ncbi:MAG: DinB family protein [Acidobacteriota bacterium]|nr:DinB family protein [Acidobacteriota bacterium]